MGSRKRKPIPNHIHRIMKVGPIWRCTNDGQCTFIMYFKQDYMLIGRDIMCWKCGSTFQFDEAVREMDMPECVACRNPEIDDFDTISNRVANKNLSTYKEPTEH